MRNERGRRHAYAARMHTLGEARLARYAFGRNLLTWQPEELLSEVMRRGNARMLLALLHQGIKPDTRATGYATPLYWATAADNPAMVSLLLRFGADPNLAGSDGWVALMHHGGTLVTRRLLYHGANPRARSIEGWTPLHFAASGGTYGSVALLLDWGADVNAATVEGITPLMVGVGGINSEPLLCIRILERLLADGADLHRKNDAGRTAFLKACLTGYVEVVQFLLARGANPKDRDGEGRDAVQVAALGEASWQHVVRDLGVPADPSQPAETVALLRPLL